MAKYFEISCNEYWKLFSELRAFKKRCYVSSVEFSKFKRYKFPNATFYPGGWDWYGCFEKWFHAGRVLRYKVGGRVWIVSNNKKCIEEFLKEFPRAVRRDF